MAQALADPRVDAWFADQDKGLRDLSEAARALLDEALPGARQALKWGYPTWVGAGNVVSVMAFPDHLNLQFFRGAELPDPTDALDGTGKGMRHVKVHHVRELRTPAVKALVRAAWRLDQQEAA
jgi:hypothetical protein